MQITPTTYAGFVSSKKIPWLRPFKEKLANIHKKNDIWRKPSNWHENVMLTYFFHDILHKTEFNKKYLNILMEIFQNLLSIVYLF